MLDHEDLKWLATTSTELNSTLQQISRYADLVKQHKGEHNYIDLLNDRVELARKGAQAIFDRVTSKILAGTGGTNQPSADSSQTPTFTIVPRTIPPVRPAAKPAPSPLPAAKAPRTEKGIPADLKVVNRGGARELLLFVEDEVEIAEIAAEMLAAEGYKVIIAHDGFEALKIYQRIGKLVSLVILDFFLPVIDGDAVFDELKTLNPEIDVVLSSGFAEQSKVGHMLAQGLRGFIPKPYTREKLLEQVRSTLEAARQQGR